MLQRFSWKRTEPGIQHNAEDTEVMKTVLVLQWAGPVFLKVWPHGQAIRISNTRELVRMQILSLTQTYRNSEGGSQISAK